MDSAIGLCYSSLPTAPWGLSSGATGATARASRVYHSLSHGSVSVSRCSKPSVLVSRSLHVKGMLDRFSQGSKNEEEDKKIVRAMGGVSIVLACVLGAFSLSSKMNPKSNLAYAYGLWNPENPAIAAPDPRKTEVSEGRHALNSLLEMIDAEVPKRKARLDNEATETIEKMKLYAVGLLKAGDKRKANKAVKVLEDRFERLKKSDSGVSESLYALEMALIEIHLFQRNYQKASDLLENFLLSQIRDWNSEEVLKTKLSDEEKIEKLQDIPSGQYKTKIFLYKAILDTVLNEKGAAKWLEAYEDEC